MIQDIRYGSRMLLKHKGFTFVAVLSLALGIGANTALFSLVDAVLLRMLPVPEPEQLVLFEWRSGRDFRTGGMRGTFVATEPGTRGASIFQPDVVAKVRAQQASDANSPMSSLFAYAPLYSLTAVYQHQAEVIRGQGVSGNYYDGLGVRAMIGRTINDSDDQVSATPVVVLSHHYWQKTFGADQNVIGQQLTLNQKSFTIIGVTAPGFVGALQVDSRPDITVPLALEPLLLGENSAAPTADRPALWWIHLMGRLKPSATLEQAQASLNGTFQAAALDVMPAPRRGNDIARDKLDPKGYPHLQLRSGSQGAMEHRTMAAKTIYVLFAVVAAVLLIACANVANLLLARSALRGPEISLRLAVGAGRFRIVRQLLTESVLLSLIGGVVGVVIAYWGKAALMALTSSYTDFLPRDLELALNVRVLAFTFGLSLLTGILFGLVPAWRATRVDLHSALKQSKRTATSVSRLSKGLIVLQVALSLLLLVGAGLFIRTLSNLQQVKLGFNQENLLLFEIAPGQNGYKDERLQQFYEQLTARLDALPGVHSATFGIVPLIAYNTWNTRVLLPGEQETASSENIANVQKVRENYFTTMEIPLLRGRGFTEQDDKRAPLVGIVNQTFAKKFFSNNDALGKRITDTQGDRVMEIVGVVGDTKYSSQREEIEPLLFTPWRQELANVGSVHFAVRTAGDPLALTNSIRQAVRELDNNLPVENFKTQVMQATEILGQERLYARLLSFFGLLALLLAAIGLSGVLAYSVAQRTNEIGIRMALGAKAGNVLRMIVWQGMKLVALGIIVGVAGGYALKRWWQSALGDNRSWQKQIADQLYGVSATDPLTIGVIAALLLGVAVLACWIPARRAASVDPLVALRHE
ncbi:MAG TPA: ABC transporter permease [Blastocatellia bacterium]|nr:ABC transporter permease [Blastocatellia bacterium]